MAVALAAICGMAMVIACGGGGGKGKPSDDKQASGPAKVGERSEAGGVTLTVEKVERRTELGQFQKAKAGREFLIAEVVIETTGRDEAPYNPMYFKLKNDKGNEHNASVVNALSDSLKSGKLPKGEKVRGTVAFDIEQGETGLVLRYEPMVIAGGYKAIKVALDK